MVLSRRVSRASLDILSSESANRATPTKVSLSKTPTARYIPNDAGLSASRNLRRSSSLARTSFTFGSVPSSSSLTFEFGPSSPTVCIEAVCIDAISGPYNNASPVGVVSETNSEAEAAIHLLNHENYPKPKTTSTDLSSSLESIPHNEQSELVGLTQRSSWVDIEAYLNEVEEYAATMLVGASQNAMNEEETALLERAVRRVAKRYGEYLVVQIDAKHDIDEVLSQEELEVFDLLFDESAFA